jgi:hypothetical protein
MDHPKQSLPVWCKRFLISYILPGMLSHLLLPISTVFCAESNLSNASTVTTDADVSAFFHALSHLNQNNPLEGAGTHDSSRYLLGLGWNQAPLASSNPYPSSLNEELGADSQEELPNASTTKLWLIKSFFYPLDAGLSFGKVNATHLKQLSGYVQLNIFESFALPALAVRAGFSRLFSLANSRFSSRSLDVVSSWGWGNFTAYGVLSRVYHRASYDNGISYDEHWLDINRNFGLSVQVIPALLLVASEINMTPTAKIFSLKLSLDFF